MDRRETGKNEPGERRVRYEWRSARSSFWTRRVQIFIAGLLAFGVAILLQALFGG
jgi:hypothetical protein